MTPRSSSLPFLSYPFQTTISIPGYSSFHVTLNPYQTSIAFAHTLSFPPSWTKSICDQLNEKIREEKRRKVKSLINNWIQPRYSVKKPEHDACDTNEVLEPSHQNNDNFKQERNFSQQIKDNSSESMDFQSKKNDLSRKDMMQEMQTVSSEKESNSLQSMISNAEIEKSNVSSISDISDSSKKEPIHAKQKSGLIIEVPNVRDQNIFHNDLKNNLIANAEKKAQNHNSSMQNGIRKYLSGVLANELEVFRRHFKFIYFSNPGTQNHLIKIEQQMSLVYQDSLQNSRNEIESLRIKHAEEMSKICASGTLSYNFNKDSSTIDVASVVNNHMNQITSLERKWNLLLMQLKEQQVRQYRKFVSDLYDQVIQDVSDRNGILQDYQSLEIVNHDFRDKVWRSTNSTGQNVEDGDVSQGRNSTSIPSSNSSNGLVNSNSFNGSILQNIPSPHSLSLFGVDLSTDSPGSGNEQQQRVINKYASAISSYLKKQKMKPSSENASHSLRDLPKSKSDDHIFGIPRENFEFPSFLSDHLQASYRVCIDPQFQADFRKNSDYPPECCIELKIIPITEFADGLSQFSSEFEIEHRAKNLGDLYRNKLSAFFIDSHLNRKDCRFLWHSNQFRKIQYHASQTHAPDLHFEDISRQIDTLQKISAETEAGDYFTTKHSNLAWIHIMMHIITTSESVQNPLFYKKAMKGLENMFEDCFRLGVENIYVPIPLINIPRNPNFNPNSLESDPGMHITHLDAIAQLQDVLQCYQRRILDLHTEECHPSNTLKRLVILINPPSREMESIFFRHVSSVVQNVFEGNQVAI